MISTSESDRFRPAVVTVGSELVYGERRNDNQEWLLRELFERGIPAEIAVSLGDDEALIAAEIRHLVESGYRPVLVSGGIGGTHDDVTRQGVAAGLGVPLVEHPECRRILAEKYGEHFTPQRQRMAELPEGSDLIANPLGAPGFHCRGVYGFPGFPNMLQPMARSVLDALLEGGTAESLRIRDYLLETSEGAIAPRLEAFQNRHPEVSIGIYPSTTRFRREVTVRLRYPGGSESIVDDFEALIQALREEIDTASRG
ncbi:MAG: molybdopterin-binding protein [Gammaproteobacteria bacterium]